MGRRLLTLGAAGAAALAPGALALLVHLGGCGSSPVSGFSGDDGGSGSQPTPTSDGASPPAFGSSDAGAFLGNDASRSDGGANGGDTVCELGSAASFATAADLNLFGQIVYYEDGGALPRGRYRAAYVGGCMKYDFIFNWQVQGSLPEAGGGGFWFVGDTSNDRIVMAPGLTTSYADFGACVAANLAVAPEEFDFDGGKIGVWLNDNPYSDNVAGEDGGNPKWKLTLLGMCPPDLVPQ